MVILTGFGVCIFYLSTRLNIDLEGRLIKNRGGFYDSEHKKFTRAILIQNDYMLRRGGVYHEPYAAKFVFYSTDVSLSVRPQVFSSTPDVKRPHKRLFRVAISNSEGEDSSKERNFRVTLDFRSRIVSLDRKRIGELRSQHSILVVKLAEDLSVVEAYTLNGDIPDFLEWVNQEERRTERATAPNP